MRYAKQQKLHFENMCTPIGVHISTLLLFSATKQMIRNVQKLEVF